VLEARVAALSGAGRMLETLSHKSVLARGYALARSADGAVVRSAQALAVGTALELEFADGVAPVLVTKGSAPAKKREKGGGADQGDLF